MASEVKSGKGYTAPKGRPTVRQGGAQRSRRMSSTLEWVLAFVVFVAILAAIFYFGRNFSSGGGGGGGGHNGAPADAPVVELFDISDV